MSGAKLKPKPIISIVGAGRMGTALALALAANGYRIGALVASRAGRARKAAALLNGHHIRVTSPPANQGTPAAPSLTLDSKQLGKLPPTDVVIIATPDDQIENVARNLAQIQTLGGKTGTVLHTSGALSSTILAPLAEKGWRLGSIHPLVAVSDPVSGAKALRGAFWCIEGDKDALRLARTIVHDLEGQSFSISAKQKPLYHAAAVMASGNLVALFDVALEMLGHCGLTAKEAQRVLLPLIESTVRNLSTSQPAEALTGTFARGDLATVQRHLKALSTKALVEPLQLYRLLGHRAVSLARKNGAKPGVLKQITEALDRDE
jgi:predicted short-subunit dehydrogenase-like oxidoreductase (DUF2520 family)